MGLRLFFLFNWLSNPAHGAERLETVSWPTNEPICTNCKEVVVDSFQFQLEQGDIKATELLDLSIPALDMQLHSDKTRKGIAILSRKTGDFLNKHEKLGYLKDLDIKTPVELFKALGKPYQKDNSGSLLRRILEIDVASEYLYFKILPSMLSG